MPASSSQDEKCPCARPPPPKQHPPQPWPALATLSPQPTLPCAALPCLHSGKGEGRAEAACLSSLLLGGVRGGGLVHNHLLVLFSSQEE